jgi:Zn-dependent M28 family amino/carboxypeptidase
MKYLGSSIKRFGLMALLATTGLTISCGNSARTAGSEAEEAQSQPDVKAPEFAADSAYQFIAAQAAFGPRVPNTQAHRDCGDYLANQLAAFGATVYNQYADVTAYDGTILHMRNIIGAYQPDARKRVMLCAHWDSRPYADNDPDTRNHRTPILGVNDGASGVGVLLEIARQLQMKQPEVGIDLIFFDAEDYGTPQFYEGRHQEDTWCLGSQYWGRTPHVDGYNARYGILLDMVGGEGATFYYEGYSARTASAPMKRIWKKAKELGYGHVFVASRGGEVTDDHYYVHTMGRIPCVDIINFDENNTRSSFGTYWHTVDDTLEHIDRQTLKAVGQTLMEVIYNER